MNNTILIVDDDKKLNGLLVDIFETEGFNVVTAYDGDEAVRILDSGAEISLVILDVMLPEVDGWEVLSYVKEHFDIKVIMLTAISDEYSEAKGLRSGADDYVVKPFKRMALVERVRRLINSSCNESTADILCDNIRVSQKEMKVYIKGEDTKMTAKEYQLLLLLMKNSPAVLTREQILERVCGFEYDGKQAFW